MTDALPAGYRIELDQFSGPLDLLLHLLDQEELSVEGIQVSRVCDRYLEHLSQMEKIDIDAAGDFLVMAATLMRMKSKSLLPAEEQLLEEEDLDPRFELVRQLIEYRRFRRAAETLDARAAEAALRFARGMHPELLEIPAPPLETAPIEATSADRLFAAFARLLGETSAGGGYVLARDDTPLEQHILRLERILGPGERATFVQLFSERKTRAYAIGVFLGILELLKRGRIAVEQDGEFGEIWIEGTRAAARLAEAGGAGERLELSGVVFLGSDDAAAACLSVLVRAVSVPLVVTQPARRRGRSGAETPTPVAAAAASLGIDVLATADVNTPESVARVAAASPRLLAVVAFGQILRRAVRETAPLGGINLHFSLLPRWRGAAPVQRAILAGDEETGVAVQRVAAKLDAGAVLAAERTPIGARETTPQLMQRLTSFGAPLLADTARRLVADETVAESVQDESLVTYASKIDRAEGDLRFDAEDAASLDRRFRAFAAAPGCRARIVRRDAGAVDVLVGEASPSEGQDEPGRVLAVSPEGIVVAARAGALRITKLQRPGGKLLDVRAFLNGCPVRAGDHFASSAQSVS